jgi:hypothetical protein
MRTVSKLVTILCFFLLGCGGSGGSSGSSKGSADTGARVLNASIDLPPVSLTTSAKVGQTLSTTKFAESTGFAELPKGEQTISIQTVDGGSGPFNFSVSIEDRDRVQVLIYGSREVFGINATLLESKKLEIPDGFAAVRVANGVTGTDTVQGSIGTSELPAAVSLGNASKHLFVPFGATLIKLTRSADSKVLANQQLNVENGKSYTFVLNGEVDYLVVGNLVED